MKTTYTTQYKIINTHDFHRGMMANEHITVGSNSYEKVKTFKYLGSLVTNQIPIQYEIKWGFKKGNHVIIQSKHFCLLIFSLRI